MTKLAPITKELYDIIGLADHIEETHQVVINQHDIWFWFVEKYEISNGSVVTVDMSPLETDKPSIALFKKYVMQDYGPTVEILAQW